MKKVRYEEKHIQDVVSYELTLRNEIANMNKVYLKEHLKKYPLMDIQDIIKLHLQAILGPAHLLPSKERIKENFIKEYNEIKDLDYHYDLLEDVSETYTRVYLKPYYELMGSFDKLVDVFYYSIDKDLDIEGYKKVIKGLMNEENKEFISRYLESDSVLISHSKKYKDNYHPHYIVVKSMYIGLALK